MSKQKFFLPEGFPLIITRDKKLIIDPTLGSHDQFAICVNGLEVARTIDEELCIVIFNFLSSNITKCFTKTKQGKKLMEVLYLLSQKEKLNIEHNSKQGTIIREMKNKKFIN